MNRLLQEVLPALGLEDRAVAAVSIRSGDHLPARTPAGELATGAVAAAALASLELAGARTAQVDPRWVAAAVSSDRHLSIDGVAPAAFAPWSGFFATRDGWVRTHGNYPHHAAVLASVLDLPAGARRDDVSAALRERGADEVEEAVTSAGGLAVRVRTPEEWRGTTQAAAVDAHPLLACAARGETGPRAVPARPRVLDLTRVIAGPVATRTLAHLGCDVLRVDPPRMPEIDWQHVDTSGPKRSTLLDLDSPADRHILEDLLARADVLVTGYRPGALARHGLDPEEVAARHPGVVQASLTAWTPDGPWGGNRGFDSIVQAATGIAMVESPDGRRPGRLPAQVLDHATGYLLAAGICAALRQRAARPGTWQVSAHLARTAHWLLRTPRSGPDGVAFGEVDDLLRSTTTASGTVTRPRPAFDLDGVEPDATEFGRVWGGDAPAWR